MSHTFFKFSQIHIHMILCSNLLWITVRTDLTNAVLTSLKHFFYWKTHNTEHNRTIQQNRTQQNRTQHNTIQQNTTHHNRPIQHNTTQHNTTQHNTTQHNTTQQHDTVLTSLKHFAMRTHRAALLLSPFFIGRVVK